MTLTESATSQQTSHQISIIPCHKQNGGGRIWTEHIKIWISYYINKNYTSATMFLKSDMIDIDTDSQFNGSIMIEQVIVKFIVFNII